MAPTKPTDLARPRPRSTQSFFTVRSAILIKRKLFLSFRSVILLHYCYSAQLFLLQCSAILENSVIFSFATVNSAILALELNPFMILSAILLQRSTIFATLLSHFVFCYIELSHFYDHVSHFPLLQ
jgi:hypothetical protein